MTETPDEGYVPDDEDAPQTAAEASKPDDTDTAAADDSTDEDEA